MNAPGSVRALVLAARRRWLAARWIESLLFGGAVSGVTLAAATLSGAPRVDAGAIGAALLAGALGALTLASERRRTPLAFARRLDRRLGAAGALATAFECEGDPSAGPLARVHVRRTLAGLDRARLRAAASPPSLAFLAALALGAAVAALALDHGPPAGRLPAAAAGAGAALARVADLTEAPAAGSAELEDALAEAAALDLAAADPATRARAADGLRSLVERPGSDAAVERAARSLLRSLGGAGAGASGGGSQASGGAAASGSTQPALADAPAGSTMSGLPPEPPVPSNPSTASRAGAPAPAVGGPAGRWWPRRHDAVVRGYLERLRAADAPRGAGGR